MTDLPCTVISITDTDLIAEIDKALDRVIFIAPAVSRPVAHALSEKWRQLGASKVQVVLDSNPEVYRLGFGDLEGLSVLQRTADQLGAVLYRYEGIRLALLVADQRILIQSPTPTLVEAAPHHREYANAIILNSGTVHHSPPRFSEAIFNPAIMTKPIVNAIQEDLRANPPVKFDLARIVRVFSTHFEFVEFHLEGAALSRKTVPIPPDLLGLARDPKAQRLLRATFALVEPSSQLSGERLLKVKRRIADKFLIPLPGYGTIILKRNKEAFNIAVKKLWRIAHRFEQLLKRRLEGAIAKNLDSLVKALLPAVEQNPPQRWLRFLGRRFDKEEVEKCLRSELRKAFGGIDDLIKRVQIKVVFKGVTVELLEDPDFVKVARQRIPNFDHLIEKFKAAKATELQGEDEEAH